jgi:hypothetical protein
LTLQPLLLTEGIVPALESLLQYAEDREEGGFHHTVIVGKVSYKFSKGSKGSNFAQWAKVYSFPGVKVCHVIHLNGTWILHITPRLVQAEPERMISYAHQVLTSAFTGADSHHVVVRRFEKSRADTGPVLEWMKHRNIKEVKCYVHDSYEARVEVTYLDPAFSPTTSRILAYLG